MQRVTADEARLAANELIDRAWKLDTNIRVQVLANGILRRFIAQAETDRAEMERLRAKVARYEAADAAEVPR